MSRPFLDASSNSMCLLTSLRNATRPAHAALDAHISPAEIAASHTSLLRYLDQFHQGLAHCWGLLNWPAFASLSLPHAEQRQSRYHALTADLQAAGLAPHPFPEAASPEIGVAIGCLYVLEGSIHGGGVIRSAAVKNGIFSLTNAGSFLAGFGADNPQRWREFTDWLEQLPPTAIQESEAGANAAFTKFAQAFSH